MTETCRCIEDDCPSAPTPLSESPTLEEIKRAIRNVKFSKSYAVGRPSALRKLDDLENLREQMER